MVQVDKRILEKPYGRLVLRHDDGTVSAEIIEFPGCFAVSESADEALRKLEEVALDWIAAALEQGQEIPEPLEAAGYSGKLVLRMAKSLHKRATLCAERDGVSLNQFIVNCLAEYVGERARPLVMQTSGFWNWQIMGTIPALAGAYMTPVAGVGGNWPMAQKQMVSSMGNTFVGLPIAFPREAMYARG